MKTNAHSTPVSAPSTRAANSRHSLLSIGKASALLGVHTSTLRQWTNDGDFPAIVSPGGTRFYRYEDVQAYLGFGPEEKDKQEGIRVAIVGRVSSAAQSRNRGSATESDLDRQHAKLAEWVAEHHPGATVKDYTSTRSGMNFSDKTFVRLLHDILDGQFEGGLIVCTHRDRVIRFGGEMLSLICERGNCELVEIDEQSEKSYGEEIAQDILAIVHHFSTKHYGRRSAEATTKRVSDECLTRMIELRQQKNYSIPMVAHTLNKEGFRMGCGREESKYDEEITEWIVRRWLDSNGIQTCLNVAVNLKNGRSNLPKSQQTPLDDFLAKHIERTGKKSDRMTGRIFRDAYGEYCEGRGVAPEAPARLGQLLTSRGVGRVRIQGYNYLAGIKLR